MNSWLKTMWLNSNEAWNRFMKNYVFSPDPPFLVEKKLDKIVDDLPAVTGTGWVRKQDENGIKVYELRIAGENNG